MSDEPVQCPECKGTGKGECFLCAGYGTVSDGLRDLRDQAMELRLLEADAFPDLLAFAKDYVALFMSSDMQPEDECHELLSQANGAITKAKQAIELNAAIQAMHQEEDPRNQ